MHWTGFQTGVFPASEPGERRPLLHDAFARRRGTTRLFISGWLFGAWNSRVYAFVDDIEAIHAELAAKGMSTLSQILDQTWGNREVGVRDPDKNVITFGQRKAASPLVVHSPD